MKIFATVVFPKCTVFVVALAFQALLVCAPPSLCQSPNKPANKGTPNSKTTPAQPASSQTNPAQSASTPPSTQAKTKQLSGSNSPLESTAPAKDQSAGTPTICREVSLGFDGDDASTYEKLSSMGNVTVKAVGSRGLLLCGPPANVDVIEEAVQGISGYTPDEPIHEGHALRLFYNRNAQQIADIINNAGGLQAPVKALGDDLLIFPSESSTDDIAIDELKHWAAMIDVPRPEVQLNAWSLQISSKKATAIWNESQRVQQLVSAFNQNLTGSLWQGWCYLEEQRTLYQPDSKETTPTPSKGPTSVYDPCLPFSPKISKKMELKVSRSKDTQFLAPQFSKYLTNRYVANVKKDDSEASKVKPLCADDEYCLGYSKLFLPIQPSLTDVLVALIAAREPNSHLEKFVDCMESRPGCKALDNQTNLSILRLAYDVKTSQSPCPLNSDSGNQYAACTMGFKQAATNACDPNGSIAIVFPGADQGYPTQTPSCAKNPPQDILRFDCEQEDERWLVLYPNVGPAFSCFRTQLLKSIGSPRSLALLRAALADFLFHYKTSEQYPLDFVPWNRGASAQTLDNLFNPLIVEFNRDITIYLEALQNRLTHERVHDRAIDYSSDGIVTVRVLSGVQASVDVTTQSFFDGAPYLSTYQFLSALTGAKNSSSTDNSGSGDGTDTTSTSTAVPTPKTKSAGGKSGGASSAAGAQTLFAHALTPPQMQAAIAFLQAGALKTAQIGRDLSLQVTATTLSGASSAELLVQLNSVESATPPSMLTQGSSSSPDNLNRVATHNTGTKVRVDSLKLFDVSTFAATLTHGRTVPLIPPFIEFPYIGNLGQLRLPPGTVYHRSFAIISAVIVPTAADIANSLEFRADLRADHLPAAIVATAVAKTPKNSADGNQKTDTSGSTTVQVQESGTQIPVTVQVGCCNTKGNCCTSAPPQPDATQADKGKKAKTAKQQTDNTKSTTVDYWIVTNYTEGSSVAGPFTREVSSNGTSAPSVLTWEAPTSAVSFAIFRRPRLLAKTGEQSCHKVDLIRSNFHGRTFTDEIPGAATCPANETQDCALTEPVTNLKEVCKLDEEQLQNNGTFNHKIFSRMTRQPRNIFEYHVTKILCLEREADPSFPDPDEICSESNVKLGGIPVTH